MTTKKSVAVIAAILFLALAFVAWALIQQNSEPIWNGMPLSAWTEDLATGSSREIREAADDAIRHIGAAGVPSLLQMLRARDTTLHSAVARLIRELNRRQSKMVFGVVSAREQHVNAALAFEVLGPIGRPAIPELKKLLARVPEPEFVADALAGIGPEGVVAILESLPKVAPEKRWVLYSSAAKWPSQAPAITAALLRSIKSPNAEERRDAAGFLGRFKQDPATTVPALISALRDKEGKVRVQALSSLAELGTNATTAIVPLMALARNKSWLPTSEVSNALARIQPAN